VTAVFRRDARLLLGVSPSASAAEVDRAFRRLAQQWHPDHGGDTDKFRRLVAARDALENTATGTAPVVFVRSQPWWRRLLHALTRRRTRAPRVQ
jgi:hypothetical protein